MKRRRRNEAGMSTGAKAAIAAAAGLAVGGLAAWWIGGTEAAEAASDVIEDLRLPQPAMKMVLAEDLEEFGTLDEVLCEIGAPIIENAPPGATADEVIAQIRLGVVRELYPNFPWPPVSGDNPTVSQLWTEIGFLARRAVVTGTICPEASS